MPPDLAALLTLAFVAFLLRRDASTRTADSAALWLPVAWLAVTGSRFVSQWLNLGPADESAADAMGGSPVDAAYFLVLITAGASVLMRRGVRIGEVLRRNPWLAVFCFYGLLSVLWSDFPLIAFKRWIKTLGHPVMALIILTDPSPETAFRTVCKRCAFLLLPASVLLIKYYPALGRGFDPYTGTPTNLGVGLTKNDLGYVNMTMGLVFLWMLTTARSNQNVRQRRWDRKVAVGGIVFVYWLLGMADSATSLLSLIVGATLLVALRIGLVGRKHLGTYLLVLAVIIATLEFMFGISEVLIQALGRDPTLTDRTKVWADALALQPNTLFGAGFESFWLGARLEWLWEKWWWHPNQAHNGYIETYLNLGLIGVCLLAIVLVSTLMKLDRQLRAGDPFAEIKFALFLAILTFNFTEAAFKAVHFIWTMFFIVALEARNPRASPVRQRSTVTAKRPAYR
jgi:O-antigen ligase